MKTVCVVTSTRADYGILRPLLYALRGIPGIELRIVATGMHLCPEFGNTFEEIEKDGFAVHKKIEIQLSSDSRSAMSKSMGMALICFSEYLEAYPPDLLVLLGDRYEIMSVACAAANQGIPIAHIHGGETTEGAVDEFFRHAITKASVLHFTSCGDYRRRVIQLGEQPEFVYDVGAMSIENIKNVALMPLDGLSRALSFPLEENGYCSVTFHPVTLEDGTGGRQLEELMSAMDMFPMKYVITKANSDAGGRQINRMWGKYAATREHCLFADSLGMVKYLSLLKYCAAAVGNSSSGIMEAPALKIPSVNIGDRQKGRIAADSVIHCDPSRYSISKAMEKAFSPEFREHCKAVPNPYDGGGTSRKIAAVITKQLTSALPAKKSFFNINFQ